jgi:hypothetical protein
MRLLPLPPFSKTADIHPSKFPLMQNLTEIAKHLAELYGIEFTEASVGHVIVHADGSEHPLESKDFPKIFGMGHRELPISGYDSPDLQSIHSFSISFDALVTETLFGQCQNENTTAGNTQYAMAA